MSNIAKARDLLEQASDLLNEEQTKALENMKAVRGPAQVALPPADLPTVMRYINLAQADASISQALKVLVDLRKP